MGGACLTKNYIDESCKTTKNIFNIDTNNVLNDYDLYELLTNEEERCELQKKDDVEIENGQIIKNDQNKIEKEKDYETFAYEEIKKKKINYPKSTSNMVYLNLNLDENSISKKTLKTNYCTEGPIISLLKQKYNERKSSCK